jgi:hypothetical protein
MASKLKKIEFEFILKASMLSSLPLRIHGSGRTSHCQILDLKPGLVVIDVDPDPRPLQTFEKVSCYLDYHGQIMTFKTAVKAIEGRRVSIAWPDFVYKDIKRKHVRVPAPRGFKAEFSLASDRFRLEYPECEEYADVSLPDSLKSGLKHGTINDLIASFREKASANASENRIVMFKDRKPELHEEKLIVKYGKILYIPSVTSGLPIEDPYPDARLITKSIAEDFEGSAFFTEGSKMDALLAEKQAAQVHAEMWSPIHYFQYVVGYVYLANVGDDLRPFMLESVDFAHEFSKVLAYYLRQNNYFKVTENPNPKRYSGKVIDVSLSGFLIEVPHELLSVRLRPDTAIDAKVEMRSGSFETKAKVARRLDDKEVTLYGINFSKLDANDERLLAMELYSRQPESEFNDERDFLSK